MSGKHPRNNSNDSTNPSSGPSTKRPRGGDSSLTRSLCDHELWSIFQFLEVIHPKGTQSEMSCVVQVCRSWRHAVGTMPPRNAAFVTTAEAVNAIVSAPITYSPLARHIGQLGGFVRIRSALELLRLSQAFPRLRQLRLGFSRHYPTAPAAASLPVLVAPIPLLLFSSSITDLSVYYSSTDPVHVTHLLSHVAGLPLLVQFRLQLVSGYGVDFSPLLHSESPTLDFSLLVMGTSSTLLDEGQLTVLRALPNQTCLPCDIYYNIKMASQLMDSPYPLRWTSLGPDSGATVDARMSRSFFSLPHLTDLTVTMVNSDVAFLPTLTQLTYLSFTDHCPYQMIPSGPLVYGLSALVQLRHLRLTTHAIVTDDLVTLLPLLVHLMSLGLYYCGGLQSLSFLALPSLARTLTHLVVRGSPVASEPHYLHGLVLLESLVVRCHFSNSTRVAAVDVDPLEWQRLHPPSLILPRLVANDYVMIGPYGEGDDEDEGDEEEELVFPSPDPPPVPVLGPLHAVPPPGHLHHPIVSHILSQRIPLCLARKIASMI